MPQARVDTGVDPARGMIAAAVIHVALFFAMGAIDPPEPEPEIIEFEIAELPEPPKPKPPAKVEKPPEPEPEPKPEPKPETKPEPKVRPKTPPSRPQTPPVQPTPTPTPSPAGDAPPFDLPEDRTIAPTTVPASPGGDPKGQPGGRPGGSGKGSAGGSGDGIGKGTGPVWAPKSDLYIKKQPLPVRIDELECPAVQDLRISGTVVLLVQVRRDGSVKQARVTKGIGHGCDEIAKKALRTGKFTPAIDTDGKSADYELRYEYVFELEG